MQACALREKKDSSKRARIDDERRQRRTDTFTGKSMYGVGLIKDEHQASRPPPCHGATCKAESSTFRSAETERNNNFTTKCVRNVGGNSSVVSFVDWSKDREIWGRRAWRSIYAAFSISRVSGTVAAPSHALLQHHARNPSQCSDHLPPLSIGAAIDGANNCDGNSKATHLGSLRFLRPSVSVPVSPSSGCLCE